ncbi:carboxypeptidase regulatory-like domain-containing protein [Roseiconus nitratireducens]|uniref:Carboxypeptidase regulatory-like domain-containing protein n=1 Tax=Roseiconus nitratireducens TaxID=2605748 RepID=A0A5M6DA17_9BACT|nr:carboxypeptidase-like regulatory domain-containing protein [Roseiconus nitratireducens]KAA5543132.1 carboxypeptidase regulatory-like domain-containing protein [Roseiconus nitratireducens]
MNRQLLILFAVLFCGPIGRLANAQNREPTTPSSIRWNEIPTVPTDQPTLHRGIVIGPDGSPMEGARIFAASTIEFAKQRQTDASNDLGKVRAVTDSFGRFEFHAPDLTWQPTPETRKRWETLLVATKEGLAPGWITTWGQDRGLRSHHHPTRTKKVAIRLSRPTSVRGRLIDADANPVQDAQVQITAVHVPGKRDLDTHVARLRGLTLFSSVPSYESTFSRPAQLPGIQIEERTDANGEFVLKGVPADNVVTIKVTHPEFQTTDLTVAARRMDDIYIAPNQFDDQRRLVLLGSGFTHTLAPGVTVRGVIRYDIGLGVGSPVAGATVAVANHNAADGMSGRHYSTDADGRFEITGLGPDYHEPGYVIAVAGSYQTPIESRRFTVHPNRENRIEVRAAVPYRLRLTDQDGQPARRDVYSIVVQQNPDEIRRGVTDVFDRPKMVAPGIYEGILPIGPGAVIVQRGDQRDRPIAVDPKSFFEPGRTDWTAAESVFSYGDQWQITQPGVITTEKLAPYRNRPHRQLDMAAVVFRDAESTSPPLELSARIIQDMPPEVHLVDDRGESVAGARMTRQSPQNSKKDLPSRFPLPGLHPERAEFIEFQHEDRGLIGFIRATQSTGPFEVVMKPAATITGSFVTSKGQPTSEFGAMLSGAVPPDSHLGNFIRDTPLSPKGRFARRVAPGETYSGQLVRRRNRQWYPRPTIGPAFEPVTPKPGEIVDLGSITVPD